MKWRFGIREKFALVTVALVLGSGYFLRQHIFPTAMKIVVDHELQDLSDEAELRSWEMLGWVGQLRLVQNRIASDDTRLQRLLRNLQRPTGAKPEGFEVGGVTREPSEWLDLILEVRELAPGADPKLLFQRGDLKLPDIPAHTVQAIFDSPPTQTETFVSPILSAELPLGYGHLYELGPPDADAPMTRVPLIWGLCRMPDTETQKNRVLAVLVPLERGRSSRHLGFLFDQNGGYLLEPRLWSRAQPPPTTMGYQGVQEERPGDARKLEWADDDRWSGVEARSQVQREKGLRHPPLEKDFQFTLLQGVLSPALISQLDKYEKASTDSPIYEEAQDYDDWDNILRMKLERIGVRYGSAGSVTGVVRLLAPNPETLKQGQAMVSAAYEERFPEARRAIRWQYPVTMKNGDVQVVRFYLRSRLEERIPGPDDQRSDYVYYFVYGAFREELSASLRYEFNEVEQESWLLGLVAGVAAFGVAFFFVRPLRSITHAARKVSGDNVEGVQLQLQIEEVRQSLPIKKHDEVGDIARGLESLLRQVLNGHERLRQLNSDLEDRVSERTRELSEANSELLGLAAAKDAFLASVSHELRQPLNSIFGYLQFLEMSEMDAAQRSDVQKLRAASTYLRRLIDDILDYQKIIMGGVEMDPEEIEVEDFLLDVKDSVQGHATERGNELSVEIDPGVGVIHQDPSRLQQVFVNLLTNAIKFTEKGQVILKAHRETDSKGRAWLVVAVQDTGRGMKPEELKSLFTKFKKLAAREGNKSGTGLGLVISKGLCELMGGNISCESEFGTGTTFTVRVPADVPAPVNEEALPTGPSVLTSRTGVLLERPSVLVIDDDASVREMMKRFLEGKGYEVLLAADGEQGVAIAREQQPAVITLDVVLPGQDGWAVLTQLKSDSGTAHIPVVMVTFMEKRGMGYSLGAADYLLKPVDWALFSQRLQKALGQGAVSDPVLVVDDDADTRNLFRRTLEGDGLTVIEAADGREALDCLEEKRPAAILLDLMMPRMDGFEFMEEFRRHPEWRGIPIMVITARHPSADERDRLDGGVRAILEKGGSGRESLLGDILAFVHRYAPYEPKDK